MDCGATPERPPRFYLRRPNSIALLKPELVREIFPFAGDSNDRDRWQRWRRRPFPLQNVAPPRARRTPRLTAADVFRVCLPPIRYPTPASTLNCAPARRSVPLSRRLTAWPRLTILWRVSTCANKAAHDSRSWEICAPA